MKQIQGIWRVLKPVFTSTKMENKDQEKEQVTSHLHSKLQACNLIGPGPALPFKDITPNYAFGLYSLILASPLPWGPRLGSQPQV